MNVFIHGYGTNVTSPVQKPLGVDKGLHALRREEFVAFDWSLPYNLSLLHTIDPRTHRAIYEAERARTSDECVHGRLAEFLSLRRPEVIIAHSLGCELLRQHILTHELPDSVRRIVWMQADIESDAKVVMQEHVQIYTIFCPWDPAMIISSIFHGKIRAGLLGMRDARAKNVFLPATRLPNPHTSCLYDSTIREYTEL